MEFWKTIIVFSVEQLIFSDGYLSTVISALLKKFLVQVLPIEEEKINVRATLYRIFPSTFPEFLIHILVVFMLYLSLSHRGANIILLKTSAFSTLIYFASLADNGVLYKASIFVQGFVYLIVTIALTIVVLPLTRIYAAVLGDEYVPMEEDPEWENVEVFHVERNGEEYELIRGRPEDLNEVNEEE